jgi:hypothetical protein
VWWTADSGVRRTLLEEKDWQRLKEKNPNLKKTRNQLDFRPYGTKIILPVMGKLKVVLKCQNGEKRNSMAYVVRDQKESLLGRLDLEALGIIVLNPKGREVVKAVTMMTKTPPGAADQVISGGQVQQEIDRSMVILMDKYQDMFEGIGQAKVAPIHIEVAQGTKPVTLKQRQVPIHLMEPLKQQLDQFVAEGVIVGPLGAEHATGWVHNVLISAKKWDKKKIRLNVDTRPMKEAIKKNGFYIPTVEQIRHNFSGS